MLLQSAQFRATASGVSWFAFMRNSQQKLAQLPKRIGPGSDLVNMLQQVIDEHGSLDSGIEPYGGAVSNPYYPALSAIAPVFAVRLSPSARIIEPCTDDADFVALVSFPSRLGLTFAERLARRDAVALLFVGFWTALLAKLERCQWWLLSRT